MIYEGHSLIMDPDSLEQVPACSLRIEHIRCQCQQHYERAIAGGASVTEAIDYAGANRARTH